MVSLLLAIIYLSFISLGLPDPLLGAAWPSMYAEFSVPVSYAGIISAIVSIGTVVSSLQSDRLTKKLGTGLVTAISVAMTAAALFGFSVSHSFLVLCLLAVPYGLGAGSVDAALNNYVALNYSSRHMSWLHCMWGIGTLISPYIMSYALTGGLGWNTGYRYIAILQVVLTAILFLSLPLWKNKNIAANNDEQSKRVLSLKEVISIRGAKEIMVTFFCYCAIEATAMLWSSSYLNLHCKIPAEIAAGFAGMFLIGITAGRAISGFLTVKMTDTQMIRLGQAIIFIGILMILLPFGTPLALAGLVLTGLGCAPVYPCIIHSTPQNFGAENSQALIGIQMASAYIGTCVMPPIFGLIANHLCIQLFPVYMLIILIFMVLMHERMLKKVSS